LFIEDIDAHGAFDVPEDPGEVAASSGSPSEAIGSWAVGGWNQETLPSGKRLHNYGKSPFLMGKSTRNGDGTKKHWFGLVGKILTGNHGFYHQIDRAFRLKSSHHPILWLVVWTTWKNMKVNGKDYGNQWL
jgi:hypothetical protein